MAVRKKKSKSKSNLKPSPVVGEFLNLLLDWEGTLLNEVSNLPKGPGFDPSFKSWVIHRLAVLNALYVSNAHKRVGKKAA